MLQIPTWSRVITILVLLAGLLIALPNALPSNVRDRLPAALQNTVTLGLDLQGGSYLLLEVEMDQVEKDKLASLMGDIRANLRKARIGYTDLRVNNDSVSVRIIDTARYNDAKTIIGNLNGAAGGGLLSAGAREYDMSEPGNSTVVMKITDQYRTQNQGEILNQSIEVVRRRIDQLGTREPTIERQGEDRILVQVPGLSDPQHLIDLLGKTAKMTFQLVDESANPAEAMKGIVPIGDELLYQDSTIKGQPPTPIVVERRVLVAGDRLTDASQQFDQQTGQTVVGFRFDTVGAREFGDATKDNVGRRFAIVLDNKIIEAPVIQTPILGGQGQITGGFTVETANDLAVLLRAGALPAPLKILEQRTVGAELGADAVKAGKY
jgi:protein-export membrane protein SecD